MKTFSRERFDAYGWQTLLVEDGNDVDAIDAAIKEGKAETKKPTIIEGYQHNYRLWCS